MAKKYRVTLTTEERGELEAMISQGKADARKLAHARVLLQADEADGAQEAPLIALACSAPPEGKRRWTLRLLAERVVELGYAETVSHETVRRTLQKTS